MTIKERYYAQGYYKGLAPEPRFEKILEIFREVKGERLLDIGCGDGSFTAQIKEAIEAKEAFGIEIAPAAVAFARKIGLNVRQLDIDEANFPFNDDYFDVIYCGEIIEHLFDPDHLLSEIHRTLKPAGICIITTPNLAGWPNRLALLLGYQPYPTAVSPTNEAVGKLLLRNPEGQWGHIRVFTLKAIKGLLRIHGFKIKQVKGCEVTVKTPLGLSFGFIRLIDRLMSKFPSLATRIIVVVEKQGGKVKAYG